MPGRKIKLVTNGIYHIFNKSIEKKPIFENPEDAQYFIHLLEYYQIANQQVRYSTYRKLVNKKLIENNLINYEDNLSNILAFCVMPTHFHLLLKQTVDAGCSQFMSLIQNAFTRYYNIKNKRLGPLFVHTFSAVEIKSEAQLKHVSRYIHLNPYSDGLVKKKEEIITYPYSSCTSYVTYPASDATFIQPEDVMMLFSYKGDRYKQFLFDNAEYQKSLEVIKYRE